MSVPSSKPFVWSLAVLAWLTVGIGVAAAQEQTDNYEGDIRDLKLGLHADAMPDGYYDLACGTNGGPPGVPLADWTEFRKCKPEDVSGLREVYLTFDDELAEIARADPDNPIEWVDRISGTVIASFPVIISALFDDQGVVRGLRAVTDPRTTPDKRRFGYLFKVVIDRRFGENGWTCQDLQRVPGETSIGDIYVKQRCEKDFPDRHMYTVQRFYRRPGQTGFDAQGNHIPADFESSTRLEIWDPSVPVAAPEQ
jgi:hypothetical protein